MNRLKELRKEEKLTQADISEILNVQPAAVSKYETHRASLTEDSISTLCKYFHVTSDFLLGLSDFNALDKGSMAEHLKKIESEYKSKNSLSEEESRVLTYYRRLNEENQDLIRGTMVQLYKEQKEDAEVSSQQISDLCSNGT